MTKRETRFTSLTIALALCLAACGGTPEPTDPTGTGGKVGGGTGGVTVIANPLCVPGQSIACAGPAGCAGGQVCKADGSGYEACSCTNPDGTGGSLPAGHHWSCSIDVMAPTVTECSCESTVDGSPGIGPTTECPTMKCCYVLADGSCDCTSDPSVTCNIRNPVLPGPVRLVNQCPEQ